MDIVESVFGRVRTENATASKTFPLSSSSRLCRDKRREEFLREERFTLL